MGRKTKNKRKKIKEQIAIPENAKKFYQNNLFFVYNYEKEREISLLEQASRLLVVESLIATVFFQVALSKIEMFSNEYYQKMAFVIGMLLVVSLIVTLISQHRFFRIGTPRFDEIKQCISKSESEITTEKLEHDYNEAFVENMYKSIKVLNDIRYWLLTISVVCLFAILIGTVCVGIEWVKDVL